MVDYVRKHSDVAGTFITCQVDGQFAIAEPPCRRLIEEVSSVRGEVGLHQSEEIVVVADVDGGVAEDDDAGNEWLAFRESQTRDQ